MESAYLNTTEFEDELLVGLDGAPSVQASALAGRQVRDDLAFVRVPASPPERNPVEEGWRQLHSALGNRSFDSPDERTTATDTALDQHLSQV